MKASAFETAILEWIAVNSDDGALKSQLLTVEVEDRDHTGVGCYTKIRTTPNAERTDRGYKAGGPLSGPNFFSPIIEHGGLTVLWFVDGLADTLEICTFKEDFPEDHEELNPFTLDRSE